MALGTVARALIGRRLAAPGTMGMDMTWIGPAIEAGAEITAASIEAANAEADRKAEKAAKAKAAKAAKAKKAKAKTKVSTSTKSSAPVPSLPIPATPTPAVPWGYIAAGAGVLALIGAILVKNKGSSASASTPSAEGGRK